MYAIIEVGAKQYTVNKDDVLEVEKQNTQEGEEIAFNKVLLVARDSDIRIGQPYVKEAKVQATVLGDIRGKKLISYKYRRRKSSHWKKGHRQYLTRVKIKSIELGS